MVEGGGPSLLHFSEYRAGLNRVDVTSSSTIIQKQHFDMIVTFFFFYLMPALFCKIKTFSKAAPRWE